MTTKAIEAGARAIIAAFRSEGDGSKYVADDALDNLSYVRLDDSFDILAAAKACIEAAIASGELVPASGEYVLVPRVPTAAMQKAGDEEWDALGIPFGDPMTIWRAILKAAIQGD